MIVGCMVEGKDKIPLPFCRPAIEPRHGLLTGRGFHGKRETHCGRARETLDGRRTHGSKSDSFTAYNPNINQV